MKKKPDPARKLHAAFTVQILNVIKNSNFATFVANGILRLSDCVS